jgi:ubiquitin-like modifier-activating enzyme ATG7
MKAWGIQKITFVDNSKVSYSNPVRQPLYTHSDAVNAKMKSETAAKALKEIYPSIVHIKIYTSYI